MGRRLFGGQGVRSVLRARRKKKACTVLCGARRKKGVSVFEWIKRVRCSTGAAEEGGFDFRADKACKVFH